MATWSHYRFQQRLLDKAREYKSCKVVLVSEEYTKCRFECDRDVNGARNILVRCMTVDRTVDKYLPGTKIVWMVQILCNNLHFKSRHTFTS
ncbi:hypothetical protein V1506DRAFT_536161 [Lipomyces tetrasporus]